MRRRLKKVEELKSTEGKKEKEEGNDHSTGKKAIRERSCSGKERTKGRTKEENE